ncbi:MAG: methionine--tRNA ligase [Myxococcota bacterium]
MTTPFYVTTPIYYVNDQPHVGHAYSTVAADVLSRYQRLRGRPVRFLTGSDEHGQKIEKRAEELGEDPQTFVDRMSPPFREAFEQLDCAFDDVIRTTEPRHKERVAAIWERMKAAGDIVLGAYEGWYSVADEAFITDKEYDELDEVTKKSVQRVSEPSYFFKLSGYADRLLAFYEAHPSFVQPEGRFNEVKSFVKQGLRDLSISRTSFRWGIPIPGDDAHVAYVWLDALTNYISALGGPKREGEEAPLYDTFWREDATKIHIVGKDILRFHAIYWPAFLMSAGLPLPTQIWAHGWLTINGQKMSKRYGNFIPPGPLVDAFGADVVRYYLMREVAFGQDGDFSHKNLIARYNGELANGLGNLLNRIIASIVKKNLGGVIPAPGPAEEVDEALRQTAERVAREAAAHLEGIAPYRALDTIFELVGAANRYVDQTAPWALAKQGETERLGTVAYTVLEALRWLSVMIAPFMPSKSAGLRRQLGLAPLAPGDDAWPSAWGGLEAGGNTAPDKALFPRIDAKEEKKLLASFGLDAEGRPASDAAPEPKATKKSKKAKEPLPEGTIAFDDFLRVELRVGLVRAAEAVPKSDKLLRLEVDLGEDAPRQILSGIRPHYDAASMLGKRVVVVTNLAPRKIMGFASQGMVLAASDDDGLTVVEVAEGMAPGARVS